MLNRLITIILLGAAACASNPPDDVFEATIPDAKSDDIDGKKFRWNIDDEAFSWFRDRTAGQVPEHTTTVALRAADKLVLDGGVVYFDPDKPDGTSNFDRDDILEVRVAAIDRSDVQFGFVMFDYGTYWADGVAKPYVCPYMGGHTGFFRSVALDFATQEVTIDDTATVTFKDCGIDLSAAAAASKDTHWALGTLSLPLYDPQNFNGTYRYRFDVAVH